MLCCSVAPLRDSDGATLVRNRDKATLLNNYFSSVFTKDNGIIDSAKLPDQVEQQTDAIFFTPDAVLKSIRGLKANSCAGPDGLPALFF